MPNLCVFCGSSAGDLPVYADAARQVGRLLIARAGAWSTAAAMSA